MEKDFDYKQVPENYIHCLHKECQRSANCLRFLVTQYAGPKVAFLSVINPAHIAAKGDTCAYFHQDRLTCFALGITYLYDNLPHKKAVKIKRILCNYLKRSTYYRIHRKERHINPAEMSLIREVFRREGIETEPLFDELIYKYDW